MKEYSNNDGVDRYTIYVKAYLESMQGYSGVS